MANHLGLWENILLNFDRAKELISDEYSCLKLLTTTYEVKLASSYVGRIKKGINDHLESQINRFVPSLGGILVAYNTIRLTSNLGCVISEGQNVKCTIQADFIIFCPEVGKILRGVVSKYGRDYVSCLVHNTFNASLPRPEDDKQWIGDSLDIGYKFLFRVTFVEHTFVRGVIIENSVRVPQSSDNEEEFQDEYYEFETENNELETENNELETENNEFETENNELEHETDETETNLVENGEIDKIDESCEKKKKKSKKHKSKEVDNENKKLKNKKRKHSESNEGLNTTEEQTKPEKKKRKVKNKTKSDGQNGIKVKHQKKKTHKSKDKEKKHKKKDKEREKKHKSKDKNKKK